MATQVSGRHGWRRLARILVILLIAVAGLLALALAFAQTSQFKEWLRGQVVNQIGNVLADNAAIRIGRLGGDLLHSIEVEDLQLQAEGTDVIRIGRASGRLNPLRALTGTLTIDHLELHDVRVDLRQTAQGWNVANLAAAPLPQATPSAGSGTRVVIDDLRLHEATLDVTLPQDSYRLADVELAGAIAFGGAGPFHLKIDTSSFQMAHHDLRIEQLGGQLDYATDGTLTAGDLVLTTAESSLRGAVRIPGDNDGEYKADLVASKLAAAEMQKLFGAAAPQVDLSGQARAGGPAAAVVVAAQVQSTAGKMAVDGTLNLAATPLAFDLRLDVQKLDARKLLGPQQPATEITGKITAKGQGTSWEELVAQIGAELEAPRYDGRSLEALHVQAQIDHRKITYEASAVTAGGALHSSGDVDVVAQAYELRVEAEGLNPAPLSNGSTPQGQLSFTLDAKGRGFDTAKAEVGVELDMAASRIGELAVQKGTAAARLSAGTLHVDRLAVQTNAGRASASGSLALLDSGGDVASSPAGTLRYEIEAADLRPLAALSGTAPLEGSMKVNGTAAGSLAALNVEAEIVGQQLAYGAARCANVKATVSASALGGAQGRLQANAALRDVEAGGQRAARAEIAATWARQSADIAIATLALQAIEDAKHRLDLQGTATLATDSQRYELAQLRLTAGDDVWQLRGRPMLRHQAGRWRVDDLTLASSKGALSLRGEGGVRGKEDFTLTISQLDLAGTVQRWAPELKGHLDGEIHLGGVAERPHLVAHASITDPAVGKIAYESVTIDADVDHAKASLRARIRQSAGREISVDLQLPVRVSLAPARFDAGDTLSGSVRANAIDLAFLDPFVAQVSELRGELAADLHVSGSPARPQLSGPLSIAGGHARVASLGLVYDPIDAQARLEGQTLALESLSIRSGKGRLTGRGSTMFSEAGASTDTYIELADFPLLDNRFGEGTASGWLWIGGTLAAPIVEGGLQTSRFVLKLPESGGGAVRPPDPTIQVIGPQAPPAAISTVSTTTAQAPAPSLFEKAALRIQIDVPHDAWLRRSDANIELRGWMTAWKKPDAELHLSGEIDVVRGWYMFQGKRFEIKEGRITFTGQDFNPSLEVHAEYRAGEYLVHLKVGGSLTKPTLKLSSEPSLSDADILSVVLFGKPVRELNEGESQGLQEQALGVAAGYAAGELRQSVANALGLDNLEFQSSGGISDSSVSLGKYVTQDVFVSLKHSFGGRSVDEVQVEYFLSPRWSIQSSTNTEGNSGIDVFWQLRY